MQYANRNGADVMANMFGGYHDYDGDKQWHTRESDLGVGIGPVGYTYSYRTGWGDGLCGYMNGDGEGYNQYKKFMPVGAITMTDNPFDTLCFWRLL